MFISHNFKIIEEEDFNLSYLNRGFQYNDGFFETIIMDNGKIRFLSDHVTRINSGLEALHLECLDVLNFPVVLGNQIIELAEKNNLDQNRKIRIKLNFWRKPGGLFTPETNETEFLISLAPQPDSEVIIEKADFSENIYTHYSPWSFLKGPNANLYVQAGIAKKQAGLDEIILSDAAGNIAECLASNIYWIKDNIIYTPALETGCIAGILRKNIFRGCEALTISIKQGLYSRQDLLTAETIFTSNVTGIRPIKGIQEINFSTSHPILEKLKTYIFPERKNFFAWNCQN